MVRLSLGQPEFEAIQISLVKQVDKENNSTPKMRLTILS